MKLPYTPSCLPNPPIWDEDFSVRVGENLTKSRNSDDSTLGEIFITQPLETLINHCDRLSKDQIESVPDKIFDEFLRMRPGGACRFASWKLSDPQIDYCFNAHPWDIIGYAPFLLNTNQLRQCVVKYPDMALMFAAKYLQLDDLVDLCISHAPLASGALLENAHRFTLEQFVRLLRDSSAIKAVEGIIHDEDLVDAQIVVLRLLEATHYLSKSDLKLAAPVSLAIASKI